jgi:hypothetical protein
MTYYMTYMHSVPVYIMHSVYEENVHNDTEFVEKLVDTYGWQKKIITLLVDKYYFHLNK